MRDMKNKKIPILKFFIILLIVGWTCFSFVSSVRAAADDSSLSNLTIDQGVLNPVFASSTLSYTAVVPYTVESLNITPTVNSPGEATLTINGTSVNSGESFEINLSVGSNTISTVTTSQDLSSVTTYTIVVTRENLIAVSNTYSGTGTAPLGIAFDGINIWTANAIGNSVTKISPTGIMTTYSGTGTTPLSIAFDGINMWTVDMSGSSVTKISPTGEMTTYYGTGDKSGGNVPGLGIAFDGTNMWTANVGDDSVTKISPTGEMTTYTGTGSQPYGIAFDGTNMWTGNVMGASVTKINVSTGDMITYSNVGMSPAGIAFNGSSI
jgi:hypothetical protein